MSRRKKKSEPWQEDALEAVRNLRAGNIIVHASDTVWGIACDSTNPSAVNRLRKLKNKSEASAILVLVADEGQIERHFENVPDAAWDLFEHSDKPTTVVLPGGKGVDNSILGSDGSLGIRLVRDPWIQFVASGLGHPIASTSANLSGSPTPANFESIESEILDGADFISSHRRFESSGNTSSFIVSFDSSERFKILRN